VEARRFSIRFSQYRSIHRGVGVSCVSLEGMVLSRRGDAKGLSIRRLRVQLWTACFLNHPTHVSVEQSRKEVDDTETYSIATLIEMQVEEWNELETSCLDSAREALGHRAFCCHICRVNYPKKFTKARINDLEFYRTEETRDACRFLTD
jgi:hypothetical protein